MSTFDELEELDNDEQIEGEDNKPIWKIKINNEEELLGWLNKEFTYLRKLNRPKHEEMIENLLIYLGHQFSPKDQKTINDFYNITRKRESNKNSKLIINHLMDLTESIVSRSTRNKPQPEVLPANSNELSDRNAARTAQQVLNHITFINRLSMQDIKLKRQSLIFGEAYTTNLWNKDNGDIHPVWLEAQENGFVEVDKNGVPLLDKKGKPIPVTDSEGEPLDPKNPMMTGEVEIKTRVPWRILLQEKDEFDDCNYCFMIEIVDVDELKEDYKNKSDKIKPLEMDIFDTNTLKTRKLRNETLKVTFWHKKTKYLRDGLEIKFTPTTILDATDLPYDHGKLPISRLTDIDVEGCLHAESFFSQVKGIQWRHNQLTSDIITNQRLLSKPKWMVPKGRADIKALGDSRTIVQFAGRVAPQLVSVNPTPQEVFLFRKELKDDMETLSTVSGVTRRDPPSQVSASVAMRFMSELESERISVATSKQNELMRDIHEQCLSIAGTYYDASDGRTIRVLGKDQDYEIQSFETSNLSKPYDVIIRNIGALAESRSAKEARIFDVLERRPELLTDEQLIDILELGSTEKMTSLLTTTLRSAEAENEALLSGKDVPEPAPYEEHITHWRVHVHRLQSYSLKIAAKPEDLEALEQHIWMTEFLMFEKAKENPTFQAELAQLKLFPIYYRDGQGFVPSSKEHMTVIAQGQANRGDEITEQIPAEDIEQAKPFDRKQADNNNKGEL